MLDWIENHGEAFLSKHTGVGKSLHRARALQKRHDDFEEVAQVRCYVWLCVCTHVRVCNLMRETRAMVLVFGGVCQIDNPWCLGCPLPDTWRNLSALRSLGEW